MSGTVMYWLIEASRDGVVFDSNTFVQGSKAQAEQLAAELHEQHPEAWIPDRIVFSVTALSKGDLIERLAA